jgi:protein O-mannosyl-transferase
MLAKTAVSFMPLSLGLVIWWKRPGGFRKEDWLSLLPMLAIAIGLDALTVYIEQHAGGAAGLDFKLNFPERVLVSGRSFWFYLFKLAWPDKLTFIYPRWKLDATAWWQWLYPLATIAVLAGTWVARRRLGKGLFVGLMHFYISTSMLVLALVLYMMRFSFVADHWAYFGSMGVIAPVAAGFWQWTVRFAPEWRKAIRGGLSAALALGLASLTYAQCRMYTDIETLWRVTIARNPGCWMAQNNLASLVAQQGDITGALELYKTALDEKPDYHEVYNNLGNLFLAEGKMEDAAREYTISLKLDPTYDVANSNMGQILVKQGHIEEGIGHFRRVLQTNPTFFDCRLSLAAALAAIHETGEAEQQCRMLLRTSPDSSRVHDELGLILLQEGDAAGAVTELREAVTLQANYPKALNNLGFALASQGRFKEAIEQYNAAIELSPRDVEAQINLGDALMKSGQTSGAIQAAEAALSQNPGDPGLENLLARILATAPQANLRDGARAAALAEQAQNAAGDENPEIWQTLAAAYAQQGKYAEAVTTIASAIELAKRTADGGLLKELNRESALYKAGMPYQEAK